MTSFEWFLLVIVVILVPLIVAIVVTLWTIDQANKRKRANRPDPQVGVKRKAALSEEEVAARRAARAEQADSPATSLQTSAQQPTHTVTINNMGTGTPQVQTGENPPVRTTVSPASPLDINPHPSYAATVSEGTVNETVSPDSLAAARPRMDLSQNGNVPTPLQVNPQPIINATVEDAAVNETVIRPDEAVEDVPGPAVGLPPAESLDDGNRRF